MVKVFRIKNDAWKKELEDKGYKILCIKYSGTDPEEVVVEPLNPVAISLNKLTIRNLDFEELPEEYLLENYRGDAVDKIRKEKNK
jgi:hypothetical protein